MEPKQRKEEFFPFFPISLLEIRTFLLVFSFSSTRIHTTRPPGSQAFRLGLNYTTGFPGFIPCRQEIVEFLSLQK